jgi:hypothetical protein
VVVINAIKVFFNNWIYPVILFVAILFVFVISGFENGHSHYFQNTAGIILCFGILTTFVSSIVQFIKKKWTEGILTIAVLFGGTLISAILFFIIATAVPMIEGDKWADNLEIPKNIVLDNPIDLTYIIAHDDSVRNIKKDKPDLQIYNSIQIGIYQYDFWFGKIDKGTIYLKAFEITHEKALSKKTLKEKSEIAVFNQSDSIMKFGSTKDFKIYEGDWGKPYAARFEVWYKSETNGQERKIFQKNFKIEGWMH